MKRLLLTLAIVAVSSLAQAQVTTFSGDTAAGAANTGTYYRNARYFYPFAAAYDLKNNLWVTDAGNEVIIMLRTGTGGDNGYYIREGNFSIAGYQDGAGAGNAEFGNPSGVAVDKNGNIYIMDQGNSAIRKIAPYVSVTQSQVTSTFAGGGPVGGTSQSGYKDAKGTDARFDYPTTIVYSKTQDALFVADGNNNTIRKIAMDGTVTTYTGNASNPGYKDGSLATALFDSPVGIYIDNKSDDMYVVETGNTAMGGRLRKISNGTVSTISVTKNGNNMLNFPSAFAMTTVNGTTNLYIANGCSILQHNMSTGATVTYTGQDSCAFLNDSLHPANAYFNGITCLLVSPDQSYMLAVDQGNNQIRKIVLPKATDIEQFDAGQPQRSIYPNPAIGHVMIPAVNTGRAMVSLYDLAGKELLNRMVEFNGSTPYELNVAAFPAGVYSIRIATDNNVSTQKLVIAHN